MLLKNFKIHWLYFWIAFIIGIIYIYVTVPLPRLVYKFPTPNDNTTYKDTISGKCYKVNALKVECKE